VAKRDLRLALAMNPKDWYANNFRFDLFSGRELEAALSLESSRKPEAGGY